jgi:hypothetical protein
MVTSRLDRIGDECSRGQLLLIGAVTIALLIFGLAIVLNSVLYTSTVSPQAASDGTANAEMYRDAVERDVGGLMRSLANGSDYVVEDDFRSNLTLYEERLGESTATSEPGTVSIRYIPGSSVTGARVAQSSSGELENKNDNETWTVAGSVTELQAFELNLTEIPKTAGQSREFHVRAENISGPEEWQLEIYYNQSSGNVVFETRDGTAPLADGCEYGLPTGNNEDDVSIDIDLPSGTVDGRPACNFTFAQGISGDYRLEFAHVGPGNSAHTDGTYEGVIQGSVPANNYYNSSSEDPYLQQAIYNATVELMYTTDSVSYRTTIADIGPRPSAVLRFSVNKTAPTAGRPVKFDATRFSSLENSISEYRWDFDGDGNYDRNTTSPTTSYTFETAGKFNSTLKIIYNDGTNTTAPQQQITPVAAINAGGSDITFGSYQYEGDQSPPDWLEVTGGPSTYSTGDSIDGLSSPNPYQTEHFGNFEHAIDVEGGEYEVTLQFAEIFWGGNMNGGGDGSRRFNVEIEGTERVSDLDIHNQVGHDTTYQLTFTVTVPAADGELNIEYITIDDNAKISGVIVEPTN